MKNTHLYILVIALMFNCCTSNKSDNKNLESDYLMFKEILNKAEKLKTSNGDEMTYAYLDSVESHSENKNISAYLNIENSERYFKDNENPFAQREYLDSIKGSPGFKNSDVFYKYLVCEKLKKISLLDDGNQKVDAEKALDNVLEAVTYLSPHEAIYSYELGCAYGNIGYISELFFNELDKCSKARQKAIDIGLKYGHWDLFSANIYNNNLMSLRQKDYETLKNESRFAIEVNLKNNIYDKNLCLLYGMLYTGYGNLGQIDSMLYYDREFKTIYQKDKHDIKQSEYIGYLLRTMRNSIDFNYFDSIPATFEYLSELNSLEAYSSYFLYSNMSDYKKKIGNEDEYIAFGLRALDHMKMVSYNSDQNLKKMRDELEEISGLLVNKNKWEQVGRLGKEIIDIDSIRYEALDGRLDVYKKQAEFWTEKEINYANEQTAHQKSRVKILTFLFGIVALFIFMLLYFLKQINASEKKIRSKNKKIEETLLLVKKQNIQLENKKNELSSELKSKLTLLSNNLRRNQNLKEKIMKNKELTPSIKKELVKEIDTNGNGRIIEDLDFQFLELHKEFYAAMSKLHPDLTNNNLKLCVYIKSDLSSKEIASLTFTSLGAVKVARSRLRKKLAFDPKKYSLEGYLNSIV